MSDYSKKVIYIDPNESVEINTDGESYSINKFYIDQNGDSHLTEEILLNEEQMVGLYESLDHYKTEPSGIYRKGFVFVDSSEEV